MTDPLYLTDSERRTADANVERVVGDRVVLDRTPFYPGGGGQPADTGSLRTADGTWGVTTVEKKDTIYHTLDREPPTEGTTVRAEIDWGRRHAHMRYHTAQHLLSAVLLEEFGASTTGNQLYDDRARIDCRYDRFDDEDRASIEARMNELIDDSLPVRWYVMDRGDAEDELDPERTRLDLLPDSIAEVRIVEVGEYDRTACAGTHVSNTAAIGGFSIDGRETKGSDEERLQFVLDDADPPDQSDVRTSTET